jgi:hypothetical protein
MWPAAPELVLYGFQLPGKEDQSLRIGTRTFSSGREAVMPEVPEIFV